MIWIPSRYKRLIAWATSTLIALLLIYELNTLFNIPRSYDPNLSEMNLDKAHLVREPGNMEPVSYIPTDMHDILRTTFKPLNAAGAKKLEKIYAHLNVTQKDVRFPAYLIGKYLLLNDNTCKDARRVDLVVLVHTSPFHFGQRQNIRNSFAKKALFLPHQVRLVFLMGKPKDASLTPDLNQEHTLYGDIVMGNFDDSYHNLTLKGVMGLRWISQYCPNSDFVLKIDDDVIIDTYKLLQDYLPHMKRKTKSFFCNVWRKNMRIERSGKWGLPPHVFFNLRTFPYYYCSGFTVLMTSDLAASMYAAAKITPFFWIDDVYVFGMLPKVVGNVTFYDYQISRNITLDQNQWKGCVDKWGSKCPYFSTLVDQASFGNYWRNIQSLHNGTQWKPLIFHDD